MLQCKGFKAPARDFKFPNSFIDRFIPKSRRVGIEHKVKTLRPVYMFIHYILFYLTKTRRAEHNLLEKEVLVMGKLMD